MYSLLLQVQPPNPAGINSNINPLFSIKRSISSTSAAVRAALVAGTTTCCAHDLCKKGVDPVTDFHVQQVIERQLKHRDVIATRRTGSHFDPGFLREAYQRCQRLCAAYAKNFYLGTLLMTDERKKAIWALYVWCRRTDDLVDGPNAHLASSTLLDIWEERLEEIFNGCPYDILDSALADTVQRFPLDIKPFKDMIEGMRMDTCKDRYENFVELYHYCYYVAGTAGLMSVPIMAKSPESLTHAQSIYHTALCLGIGNQLTNILRDVGEDALRGRIYLPQDELREFGLKDKDVFSRKVTHKWREFMKKQIMRARAYFDQAEQDATQLDSDSRWPAWSSLMLYRRILKEIENNDYDNLTKQAHVGTPKKLLTLLLAYTKAVGGCQCQPISPKR